MKTQIHQWKNADMLWVPISIASMRWLIVLGFKDTWTRLGHFVSSPKETRKDIEEIVEEMNERDREERGKWTKVKKQKK